MRFQCDAATISFLWSFDHFAGYYQGIDCSVIGQGNNLLRGYAFVSCAGPALIVFELEAIVAFLSSPSIRPRDRCSFAKAEHH